MSPTGTLHSGVPRPRFAQGKQGAAAYPIRPPCMPHTHPLDEPWPLSTREESCCIKTPRQQQSLSSSALCGASHIPNRPRQTLLPSCKLNTDSSENTMKASEGSPRESLCWQAWSHHGGSQELRPEHAQLPHTATQTDKGSSLPHSDNVPHSSSPGAAKIRKAAALGVSTVGRELKKKSMFTGG